MTKLRQRLLDDLQPLEFSHTLEAQIGGQIEAGFVISGFLEELSFGRPGSTQTVRYSGILSSGPPERVAGSIRKMRWYGLRDFKLKVGDENDDERLQNAAKALGGPIARGRALDWLTRPDAAPLPCAPALGDANDDADRDTRRRIRTRIARHRTADRRGRVVGRIAATLGARRRRHGGVCRH
jgi:hypothetical protein